MIGSLAFASCYNLKSVIIPASVTTVGELVFAECFEMTDIYCEAESKPDAWSESWNVECNATVHWGYKAEPELAFGDIDGDEAVTTADYVFTKRAVMGTYEMTEAQIKAADIDKDSAITTADYVFVKRAVMGTYTLNEKTRKAADIDKDNEITAADYVFVKRAVMGTYTIKG
jgi:hypothetical protein